MSKPKLHFRTAAGESLFLAAYQKNLDLWPVAYESRHVETRFGSTHVITAGPDDAPPLLLIHGFGFSATMWASNIAALAADRRVYAVDIMGDMNQSVPSRAFANRREMAEWLCELLDALGVERTVVVGHSYGGWLSLNLALNAPERVERMVLLAPAASFVPMVKQFYLRVMGAGLLPGLMSRSFAQWCVAPGHTAPAAMVEQFHMGLKHYRWGPVRMPDLYTDEELRQIDVPALLLMGDHEVIYDAEAAIARARRLLKGLTVTMIPDAGHALSIEQPDLVNQAIRAFIGADPAAGSIAN